MATVTAYQSLSLTGDFIGRVYNNAHGVYADGSAVVTLANDGTQQVYAGNFQYTPGIGLPTSGNVIGFAEIFSSTASWYDISNISVPVNTLYGYYNAGDSEALRAYIFAGNDVMYGSNQSDLLTSYYGSDVIYGNGGDDALFGNQDSDTIYGGDGSDFVYGGKGADLVAGGNQDDLLFGNMDNDAVYGESGNDFIYGNLGNDVMFGGDGNDFVTGQRDNDTLYGNAGADTFGFYSEGGSDVIKDFQNGVDSIFIESNINGTGIRSFAGLAGRITESNGSAIIDLSGTVVVVEGVHASALDASDFLFL